MMVITKDHMCTIMINEWTKDGGSKRKVWGIVDQDIEMVFDFESVLLVDMNS